MLGEALGSYDVLIFQLLSFFQRRQQACFVFLLHIVVVRFAVNAQETVELDHFASSCKGIRFVADADGNGGLFYFGVGHLRGDGAFPYQVVQTFLLRSSVYFRFLHIGGADGFVRFLCTLGLGGIVARADVAFAHQVKDGFFAAIDGVFGQVD